MPLQVVSHLFLDAFDAVDGVFPKAYTIYWTVLFSSVLNKRLDTSKHSQSVVSPGSVEAEKMNEE